jgi:hypothetical protein
MTIYEVDASLGYTRDRIKELIDDGMPLPRSNATVKLAASMLGGVLDISEAQLDEFIDRFAAEDPERYPRTAVRRELLVESRHACAICEQFAPPQFHHMLEWSKIKHHDPRNILHLCGTCHDRCSKGEIDKQAQIYYKARLRERVSLTSGRPIRTARRSVPPTRSCSRIFLRASRGRSSSVSSTSLNTSRSSSRASRRLQT